MAYGLVYLVANRNNGKVYIGQTVQDLKRRWDQHVCQAKHRRKEMILHQAILKHGRDAFFVTELSFADSQADLDQQETDAIVRYEATQRGKGYNTANGGRSHRLSAETKRKIGLKAKIEAQGRTTLPTITKERIRETLRGRSVHPPWTEDQRKHMSLTMTGKPAWNKGCPPKATPEQLRRRKAVVDSRRSGVSFNKIADQMGMTKSRARAMFYRFEGEF